MNKIIAHKILIRKSRKLFILSIKGDFVPKWFNIFYKLDKNAN